MSCSVKAKRNASTREIIPQSVSDFNSASAEINVTLDFGETLVDATSDLTWQAPAGGDGFALQEWSDPRKPELGRVAVIADQPDAKFRPYHPLQEETGLHRMFSELDPTPEVCLGFANRFGRMELPRRACDVCSVLLPAATHETPPHPFFHWTTAHSGRGIVQRYDGEPIFVWQRMVRWLRPLVNLWDMIQGDDREQLAKLVRWAPDGVGVRAREDAEEEFWPFSEWSWGSENSVAPGDVVLPALRYLHLQVNYILYSYIRPALVWDREAKTSALRVRPDSLWTAICVQFAQAIGGNKKYQKCPTCGRWFELSPGVNRANKEFCSGTCRTKATRQRKERALQLHAQGKSVREIAREVESGVDTVKRWVARKREK
jgi:hypothetical protein